MKYLALIPLFILSLSAKAEVYDLVSLNDQNKKTDCYLSVIEKTENTGRYELRTNEDEYSFSYIISPDGSEKISYEKFQEDDPMYKRMNRAVYEDDYVLQINHDENGIEKVLLYGRDYATKLKDNIFGFILTLGNIGPGKKSDNQLLDTCVKKN